MEAAEALVLLVSVPWEFQVANLLVVMEALELRLQLLDQL
jgi:hypothetical protein